MKKVELLSPVGNMESLKAAVFNGADAVYLGGKKFGARKYAQNFDNEELIEAIRFCHLYSVKIYVTVNTIIYEKELEEVLDYIDFLHKNNVDAIIVQDIGLIRLIRKIFPNLEVHASTQCHNNSSETVKALKELGVKRVVLARELSLEEIKNIDVDIEKEVFVHGALCISYSGCCLWSSMNGGRSGNRGECVGSCRLPYKLLKNGKKIETDGDYLLSTRSLCTLEKVGELIESGITSFKIEGRMKSKEYIGYITSLYRNKIDEYYKTKKVTVTDSHIINIKKLYNRELTKGYLFGDSNKSLMNIKTSNHIGITIGKVIYVDKKIIKVSLTSPLNQEDGIRFDNDLGMIVNRLYDEKGRLVKSIDKGIAVLDNKIGLKKATIVRKTQDSKLILALKENPERKVDVNIHFIARVGEKLHLLISSENEKVETSGSILDKAVSSPTSKERVQEQLEKLGNTPFICKNIKIEMDDNVFISIKELNELRRESASLLEEKLKSTIVHPYLKEKLPSLNKSFNYQNTLAINMLVRNEEQLKVALDEKIDSIYVTDHNLYEKYKDRPNVFLRTKRNATNYKDLTGCNILATDLGSIFKYSKNNRVVSDYYLNIVNSSSISYLIEKGVERVTLSVENTLKNVKDLESYANALEVIVYGRVELMLTKYCPLNMLVNSSKPLCNVCKSGDNYALEDENGNVYPIVSECNSTHIMHSKNINLIDNIPNLKRIGITNYRIELFNEKEEEIIKIIKEIRSAYE